MSDPACFPVNEPFRMEMDNYFKGPPTGQDGATIVADLMEKEDAAGYDAAKGKFVDMFEAGIIDPAKVARIALQNAASVAGLMLTTNVLVTNLEDDEEPVTDAVS